MSLPREIEPQTLSLFVILCPNTELMSNVLSSSVRLGHNKGSLICHICPAGCLDQQFCEWHSSRNMVKYRKVSFVLLQVWHKTYKISMILI